MRAVVLALVALVLASCSGCQSALDPQGPAAQDMARLIWTLMAVCAGIWLIVIIILGLSLKGRRGTVEETPEPTALAKPRLTASVMMATGATVVCIAAF